MNNIKITDLSNLSNPVFSAATVVVQNDTVYKCTIQTIADTIQFSGSSTLYTGDDSLTGNRTVDLAGYDLTFNGTTATTVTMDSMVDVTGDLDVTGTVTASAFSGDGSSITDVPGATLYTTTGITITSGQTALLATTPQTILAAPGSNKLVVVDSVILKTSSGTAYTGGTEVKIGYSGGSQNIITTTNSPLTLASKTFVYYPTSLTGLTNENIAITAASNPSGGTLSMQVYLSYHTVSL